MIVGPISIFKTRSKFKRVSRVFSSFHLESQSSQVSCFKGLCDNEEVEPMLRIAENNNQKNHLDFCHGHRQCFIVCCLEAY